MTAQRKYPDELRERAVKMLSEVREREGKRITPPSSAKTARHVGPPRDVHA
jgi:hypothetical protein